MKDKRYTVFEASNARRKELFFGVTDKPVFEAIRRLKKARPDCLSDWDFDDIDNFRSIEFDLSDEQARTLIERLARMPPPEGWRALRDKNGKPQGD